MRAPRGLILALGILAVGCGSKAAVRAPVAAPAVTPEMRLARAGTLVRDGCFDCLTDAFREYQSLLGEPAVAIPAADGAIRTAALIALRESELGLAITSDRPIARSVTVPLTANQAELLESAEALAGGSAFYPQISRRQEAWAASFRSRMSSDPAAAYFWLDLACGVYGYTVADRAQREVVVGDWADTPLVQFKLRAACPPRGKDVLQGLLARNPRFKEIEYYLGVIALIGTSQVAAAVVPDLETAEAHFQAAYSWRQDWPTLTLAIANLAMTAEDFERAVAFYDRTLELAVNHPDALVGAIRARTYLGRYEDAIAAADRMLMTDRSPGEARYWRAFNESQLNRDDEAWTDIEQAATTLINADVPKLAGIIAVKRRQFATARQRLEVAVQRRRTDCETRFYLQAVLSELRQWPLAALGATEAAACFDTELTLISREIDQLRAADMPEARRARQIARREQQIAGDRRMRATSWFNAAAANYNLANKDEARRFAELLVDDTQFNARAREIIELLDRR